MVGLKRKTVKLSPYSKKWVLEFEKEKRNLQKILCDKVVCIEHCGSTAVPGLKAKPVIDVLVGVKTVKKEGRYCSNKLNKLKQYHLRNNYFSPKNRLIVAKGNQQVRTHYIHIVRYKGAIWNRLIKFRDILRNNKKLRLEYQRLKEDLSKAHPGERKVYTKKKSDFIKRVLG